MLSVFPENNRDNPQNNKENNRDNSQQEIISIMGDDCKRGFVTHLFHLKKNNTCTQF